MKLTITHTVTGRRRRKRCVATRSKHISKRSRCTLEKTDGNLTRRAEHPGADSVAFSGRIGHRALSPRGYRLQIGATDAAGNKARTRTLSFTIVKA